jgi:predicted DNA-binding antitoxin AbrB/MazE fold protein
VLFSPKEVDMKETIEAIYEKGVLRLLKKLSIPEGRRIKVTLESQKEEDAPADGSNGYDFSDLAGSLKDSPRFSGDPLAIQKAMRDEW